MSVEQNKAIALRWNAEVIGKRKIELIDELLHPDYVNDHNVHGLAAAKEAFTAVSSSAGGFAWLKVLDVFGEGDKVAMRWSGSDGTKTYRGITIYRIEDNKIREDWYCAEEIAE